MAPPTRGRALKTPTKRVRADRDGYFFPNEVVRMLSLERLDYRQLRRLFRLVATSRGEVPSRRWARFTFQDLAALRAAVNALGGPEAIATAKRIPIRRLERACEKLRTDYGLTNPLTQARLVWNGHDVVVQLLGARFEPDSGQLLLRLADNVDAHLQYSGTPKRSAKELKARIVAEERRIRQDAKARTQPVVALDSVTLRFGRSR